MYGLFSGGVTSSVTGSSRAQLATLGASVGAAGLAAAAARPELLAAVDQHAAAVRDSLDGDRRPLTPAALAGYADGVRAAALEHGWCPPDGPVDWSAPGWILTRLVAVHALALGLPDRERHGAPRRRRWLSTDRQTPRG